MRNSVVILLSSLAVCTIYSGFLIWRAQQSKSHDINDVVNIAPIKMPVYPREAGNLPITDLASLVVAVLPSQPFDQLGWDDMIDNPLIQWITEGVSTDSSTGPNRIGLVRVWVAGKPSTRIRKGREEIAWAVTLGTDGAEKFGPKWVRIEVGPPGQECFGSLDDGCTFTAEQALSAPSLTKQNICEFSEAGGKKQVYSIAVPGKPAALFVYNFSEGSGGSSANFEIRPISDKVDVCKPDG